MKADNTRNCVCGSCSVSGIIWSIIGGIAAAVLFYLGYITSAVVGIWITFGIAAFSLIYILLSTFLSSCSETCARFSHCLHRSLKCLLIGSIGTIVVSIAALSISLTTTAAPTIIVGLLVLFFILLLSAIVNLLKCIVK